MYLNFRPSFILFCGFITTNVCNAKCIEYDIQPPAFCTTVKGAGNHIVKQEDNSFVQIDLLEIGDTAPNFLDFPKTKSLLANGKRFWVITNDEMAEKIKTSNIGVRGVLMRICNDNSMNWKWMPSFFRSLIGINKIDADYIFASEISLPLGKFKGKILKCTH